LHSSDAVAFDKIVGHDFIQAGKNMTQPTMIESSQTEGIRKMLAEAGYSQRAIEYYIEKPYMGTIPDAELKSEMTGTCGDTMGVYVKMNNGTIQDAKYEVLGCAGAVSAAMAAVDLIKGAAWNMPGGSMTVIFSMYSKRFRLKSTIASSWRSRRFTRPLMNTTVENSKRRRICLYSTIFVRIVARAWNCSWPGIPTNRPVLPAEARI
jgi:hypothetical protein